MKLFKLKSKYPTVYEDTYRLLTVYEGFESVPDVVPLIFTPVQLYIEYPLF